MARTITIKGIGKVSVKPDYVILSMSLESRDLNYNKAMNLASQNSYQLKETIAAIGLDKNDVKTTGFDIGTDYNNVDNGAGSSYREFKGYVIRHSLRLEFDYDMEVLSRALFAIAGCLSHPELSITFTMKDPASVHEEVLRAATANARCKAQILCEASGTELGMLQTIDYDLGGEDILSRTKFSVENDFQHKEAAVEGRMINIEPDNIEISDTVTFIWQIRSSGR